MFIVDVETYGM